MQTMVTVLSVENVEMAKQFYQELFGFSVKYNFGINITFTCGLSLQENFSKIMNVPKKDINQDKTNNFEICFEIIEFDEFIKKLNNNFSVEYLHNITEYDWGQRVIHFYDLDNHLLEVGESMVSVVKNLQNKACLRKKSQ